MRMLLSPLCGTQRHCSVVVSTDAPARLSLSASGQYVCFHHHFSATLCRLRGEACELMGTLFFRSTESGAALSVLTSTELLDFPCASGASCSRPQPSSCPQVVIEERQLIVAAHFCQGALCLLSKGHLLATVMLQEDGGWLGCMVPVDADDETIWVPGLSSTCMLGISRTSSVLVSCDESEGISVSTVADVSDTVPSLWAAVSALSRSDPLLLYRRSSVVPVRRGLEVHSPSPPPVVWLLHVGTQRITFNSTSGLQAPGGSSGGGTSPAESFVPKRLKDEESPSSSSSPTFPFHAVCSTVLPWGVVAVVSIGVGGVVLTRFKTNSSVSPQLTALYNPSSAAIINGCVGPHPHLENTVVVFLWCDRATYLLYIVKGSSTAPGALGEGSTIVTASMGRLPMHLRSAVIIASVGIVAVSQAGSEGEVSVNVLRLRSEDRGQAGGEEGKFQSLPILSKHAATAVAEDAGTATPRPKDAALLIDFVFLSKERCYLVCLSNSGRCQLVTNESREVHLATLRQPHEITVLSVFSEESVTDAEYTLLCGSRHGGVYAFSNGEEQLKHQGGHCGAVSRLYHSSTALRRFDVMFMSASFSAGTVCAYNSQYQVLYRSFHGSTPLSHFEVDITAGVYILSDASGTKKVSVWGLANGQFHHAGSPEPVAASIGGGLTTVSSLRLLHHRLFTELYFFLEVDPSLLLNELKSSRRSSVSYQIAVTVLLVSCGVYDGAPALLHAGFLHMIDQLSLYVPPVQPSPRSFLYAIELLAALWDFADDHVIAYHACEAAVVVHHALLDAARKPGVVVESVLLQYFQHLRLPKGGTEEEEAAAAAVSTYTMGRLFFPHVTHQLTSYQTVLQVLEMMVKQCGLCDHIEDRIDCLGMGELAVWEIFGFASAVAAVWKFQIESSSALQSVTMLLHAFVLRMLDQLKVSGPTEYTARRDALKALLHLSDCFWLNSELISRSQWIEALITFVSSPQRTPEEKHAVSHILQHIAAVDLHSFYESTLIHVYSLFPSWRQQTLALHTTLLQKYTAESYLAPYPLLKVFTHLFAPLPKATRSETAARTEEALSIAITASELLPNISIHRSLHSMAFGLRDGCLAVLHLQTGDMVTFVAHSAAVLCVAYCESIVNAHVMATVSENLKAIYVWRSPVVGGYFRGLLSAATLTFTIQERISLSPALRPPPIKEEQLFSCCMNSCAHSHLTWASHTSLALQTPSGKTETFTLTS